MRIETCRFGTLEVDPKGLIELPEGLVGLPEHRRFVVLDLAEGVPLGWMQSADHPDFGLPVADPTLYRADYRVEIPREQVLGLGLASQEDAVFLIVTTIRAGGAGITGNLRAPIVVNGGNRRARQIVLEGEDLELRAPVDPLLFARAVGLQEGPPRPAEAASAPA